MLISIIIPTLNEETNLENLLRQLNQLEKKIPFEIIVVDGGSQDATIAIASDYAKVYQLKQGNRGAQLKLGAEKSRGEILWFLHSDSRLDNQSDILAQIHRAVANKNNSAGFLKLSFDSTELFYRYLARTSTLRAKYLGLIFGDQGLFTTRENCSINGRLAVESPIEKTRKILLSTRDNNHICPKVSKRKTQSTFTYA